ncbi:MAG: hypothetical protein N2Z59_06845, partial [Alteraurantiacibacter sp.]|nr:hypothetical protein [Alteraurantiacibacter sp.]
PKGAAAGIAVRVAFPGGCSVHPYCRIGQAGDAGEIGLEHLFDEGHGIVLLRSVSGQFQIRMAFSMVALSATDASDANRVVANLLI